jgi:serine/threonine protein kinase
MLRWGYAKFAYDVSGSPDEQTIDIGWDRGLVEVVTREREEQALRPGAPPSRKSPPPSSPEPRSDRTAVWHLSGGAKVDGKFWDKVYQAEQTSIGRPVALHVLAIACAQLNLRPEFLDTASINAELRPSILPVYEAGEHEGTYFYAREFVTGRTAYEIKASGHIITETTALHVVRAIAHALAHLDDNGILHAPLRLSRIFVTPNDEAKLADVAVANPALAQLAPPKARSDGWPHAIPLTKALSPGAARPRSHPLDADFRRDAITSWGELAQEAKKLATIVGPPLAASSLKKTGMLDRVRTWGKRS